MHYDNFGYFLLRTVKIYEIPFFFLTSKVLHWTFQVKCLGGSLAARTRHTGTFQWPALYGLSPMPENCKFDSIALKGSTSERTLEEAPRSQWSLGRKRLAHVHCELAASDFRACPFRMGFRFSPHFYPTIITMFWHTICA